MKTDLNRGDISAEGFRFAIVVSRWNDTLTSKLESGARDALTEVGATEDSIETYYVPGAFELPLACLKAAETGDFDAVIALGVVIRGDTPHFDYVAGQAAAGILQASMQSGVPVMFGVITVDYLQQAVDRTGEKADNKGYEAAMSAVEMVSMFREMDRRNADLDKKVLPHVA
ncbi:MAG TPA: 6,7-dimethyl-8-ribityllumazine synthase [Pyrinomonadaceae bacterium]|nr:6,7-dimethyl-8-ribityllumazine synthase [Pyrinomonadaceae bacterium]